MKYQVQITDKILKKLEKLSQKDKQRIVEAIDSLVEDLRPDGCKNLREIVLHHVIAFGPGTIVLFTPFKVKFYSFLWLKSGTERMFINN